MTVHFLLELDVATWFGSLLILVLEIYVCFIFGVQTSVDVEHVLLFTYEISLRN